jgi:GTP diphosphokinase / guanosine-3',5'-bis(diphosphate) 3'-diphosphatase
MKNAGDLLMAMEFAAEKHKYQRRKGFNEVPYINHPIKVANLLFHTGKIYEKTTILAAILHDVLEDTESSEYELLTLFGSDVVQVVKEVTDDMTLSYEERKRLQIIHAPNLSANAKVIKIADKICNMRDIISYPLDWTLERKLSYFEWADKVVQGCRGINFPLEKEFDTTLVEGIKQLNQSNKL